ncbi:hypothetical protein [Natronoflexus pectinivorans]|uniref:Uncharacterized protein n=1 Tax=Natronoflexus pectinivorans TaxID=682526 RepID=A0A4V2RW84_9BACT|nr:hypothetical protein [Natronoflexus pectinivorans]TCO07262.1 hypothetical protein EV194_10980 [Natronoflexus pectinivorans]
MKKGEIKLIDLDFEYKIWKNRLSSYIKEVEIIKNRNKEVADCCPGKELNTVEIMVLEQHETDLTQLLNRIKVQEQSMQFYNKDFPITADHEHVTEHNKIREKMAYLCSIHTEKVNDLIDALGI